MLSIKKRTTQISQQKKCIHTHTTIYLYLCIYTYIHKYTYPHPHPRIHTHTNRYRHRYRHRHRHTGTQTHRHTHSITRAHTHTMTLQPTSDEPSMTHIITTTTKQSFHVPPQPPPHRPKPHPRQLHLPPQPQLPTYATTNKECDVPLLPPLCKNKIPTRRHLRKIDV
jgi:hypothetical protein